MASYKTAIRSAPSNNTSEPKTHDKARQLQEFFPAWSHDDLQSLLVEVNGDVEVAATRISDGKAEQWGSVSRKKDKKVAGHSAKDSISSGPPSRGGDFRGGRGGARGGRGGPVRGAVRGGARGDFRGGRGGFSNGHVSRTSSPAIGQHIESKPTTADASQAEPIVPAAVVESTPATWDSKPEEPTPSAWAGGSGSAPETPDTSAAHVNGHIAAPAPAKQIYKSPATSKLSWAQIARPQEKPAPPSIVQQPAQPIPSASAPEPIDAPPLAPPEPEPSTNNTGWEDPTTVQTPSFDEEPAAVSVSETEQQEPESEPVPVEVAPQQEEVIATKPSSEPVIPEVAPPSVSTPAPPTPTPSTPSKVAARPAATSTHRNSARYSNYAKIASDQGGVVMPPTPSSIGANLSTSIISSFGTFGDIKSSGVEKVGMQFGSLSLGGSGDSEPEPEPESEPPAPEVPQTASVSEPATAPSPTASTSLNSALYTSQPQPLQTSVSQPAVSSSISTNSPAQSFQQVQAQPQSQSQSLSQLPQQLQQQAAQAAQAQAQAQAAQAQHQNHYAQHGLPTHIDPSAQTPPQQAQQNYLRQSDQSPYSSGFHQTPTPPSQDNNGYGSFGSALSSQGLGIGAQAGLSGLTGMGQGGLGGLGGAGALGGAQGLGHHQQQQSLSAFDNYGYEGGQRSFYDSYQPNVFNGRNVLGHDDLTKQAQQTPTTSTASSLPPSTSASSQSSIPQSPATSVSVASSAQGQSQLQGQGGPAPAGYHGHPAAPVPTYYYQPFPHQNSYYNAAAHAMGGPYNSGYGVGVGGMGVGVGLGGVPPYPGMNVVGGVVGGVGVGKYPAMYAPGPPGSAPSPAGKQGVVGHGISHQPQSYGVGGGLYGQQQGYDDYQQQQQQQQSHHQQQQQHHSAQSHHQQHQQHQQHAHSSHGLGLGGQDYSKPSMYGGQGGLQGYGASSTGVTGSGGVPRGGASPETAYKPYAPKDISGVGRGNVQQGQGQSQGQGQVAQGQGQGQGQAGQGGPQGQGYYGGAGGGRFGSTGSVGVAPNQTQQLYPQGQSDAGYYYQQQRQQQYWQ